MSDPRYQVDVSVVTRYLADQSQPEHHRFAFAYTITVQNNGERPAQLMSRHWVITTVTACRRGSRRPALSASKPLIEVGKSHTYSSGTVMTTKVGTMQGTYEMVADDGKHFDAIIKPFRLAVPGALH
ncbi:Co2+/Mg2+ efflux protein ApaG [Pseudomonas sp. S8]|uniref:Co2+/Mg2+ efflux protein ApaG n=1 Tax=Pseudomonas sp. S8 TaxID=211136 RepID=UPI003D2B6082